MSSPAREFAIGIDLGTTNSCVAAVVDGVPHVIPCGGYLTTPSVVAFTAAGKRLVGHAAKRQAITNPEHTIIAMKRLIGRKFKGLAADPATAHQAGLIEGPHGDIRVSLRDKSYSLPELNAMLLQELRAAAEEHLKAPVTKAVITVPAYFNDNQRQATRDAGEIAGLQVIAILNEPTAAALAYGANAGGSRAIVVYDLGGGTFDVSIVRTQPGGVFEVLATGGDTLLGGEDFDARIMTWLLAELKKESGIDLSADRLALQRLKQGAEAAKCALRAEEKVEVSFPFIAAVPGAEPVHFTRTLSRGEMNDLTKDLVARTITVCADVLAASNVPKNKIDDVLLVGGSSRLAAVQAAVTAHFGKSPSQRVNPDEAVAIGAALHADSLESGGEKLQLLDVTPQTLSLLAEGAKPHPIIPRNSRVPTKRTMTFSTRKEQTRVDLVVMQGDSKRATDNEILGQFSMSDVSPGAKLDVTFDLDTDGIVKVTARDQGSGKQQSIEVSASSGLTDDELSQMTAASQQFLTEQKTDTVRTAALQEVQKALALLERAKADADKAIGKTTNGAAVIARVAQSITTAKTRASAPDIDVEALKQLAEELMKKVTALRGG